MANNRMLLVHIPTGLAVHLSKRLALGWYVTPGTESDIGERLGCLYKAVQEAQGASQQDDFAVALEHADGAQLAVGDWDYGPIRDDGVLQLVIRPKNE